jgi:hypothetical protein
VIVAPVTARSIDTVIERCVSTLIDCLRFYGVLLVTLGRHPTGYRWLLLAGSPVGRHAVSEEDARYSLGTVRY